MFWGGMDLKRILALIALLCIPFFSFGCFAAEGDLYCSYEAKTENGTLFYIDVYCKRDVAAAVFELGFDSGTAEYREASAADSAGNVRANLNGDTVTVAFASGTAKSGKLCRLTFNGLRSGDCRFSLHMKQACDGDLKYISGLPDQSLTVKLGKDGKVTGSSSSSSASKADPTDKSGSKSSGNKSSKSDKSEISSADDDSSKEKGVLYDLRKNEPLRYILLGAGGVVLIGLLVFSGYLIGRKKSLKADTAKDKTPDDNLPLTAASDKPKEEENS